MTFGETNGKLGMAELRKALMKKRKDFEGYNLKEDSNPTDVTEWISTGSRWLDCIICKGKKGGLPVRKVVELAGLTSTGKSYLAAQAAANAQKMGFNVIYFDSENAIDPAFLENAGCNLDDLLYIPAKFCEDVFEIMEDILASTTRTLFIWDSLALTPCRADLEGDFNPNSSISAKARVISLAMQKLIYPIAHTDSCFLVLNQLKDNIQTGPGAAQRMMVEPYFTPGGKSLPYSYSLRIWLTRRRSKASFIVDEKGYKVGSEVTAKLEKSRFGTEGRICTFKILWGDPNNIGVMDEESWIEAIKNSKYVDFSSKSYKILDKNGEIQFKTSRAGWKKKLEDPVFKKRIFEIMDEEVVEKFDKRLEKAEEFYTDTGLEEENS